MERIRRAGWIACIVLSGSAVAAAQGVAPIGPTPPAAPGNGSGVLPSVTAPEVVERRPVAVVDLAGEAGTRELAEQLRSVLDRHPALRSVASPTDAAALIEPLDDADTPRLVRVASLRARAEEALGQFDNELALRYARDAQLDLLSVSPSVAARPYAELAFLVGVAHWHEQRVVDAKAAFAQVDRLDPSRVIDPARLVPGVVNAYAEAKAEPAPAGQLEIAGTGNVWIDGIEVGVAPRSFQVAAGGHVVWLTGVNRETRGATVVVGGGMVTTLAIADAEASRRTKVQRARQLLARAPDPTARAAAMKRLAELIAVEDAVLLSIANGKLIWQTWRAGNVERAPGFSALRERTTERPDAMLDTIAPPRRVVPEPPDIVPPKVVNTTRWFERRPVQAGLVVGIAAAIVGGVLWATRDPGSQRWGDPSFATPQIGRR